MTQPHDITACLEHQYDLAHCWIGNVAKVRQAIGTTLANMRHIATSLGYASVVHQIRCTGCGIPLEASDIIEQYDRRWANIDDEIRKQNNNDRN